jgi:hypothetical protein
LDETRVIEAQPDGAEWGPWRAVMEESVFRCSAAVHGLRRSLNGEQVLKREDFSNIAERLYDAANELVERCEDVGRWHERWEGEEAVEP